MHRIAAALLVGTLVLAAGCGGGSSSQSPAKFRSQVVKLCTDAQKKVNAISAPASAKDLVPYLKKTEAVAGPYVDKLASLKAPATLAPVYKRVVSLNQRELALLKSARQKLEKGTSPQSVAALIQRTGGALSKAEDAGWRSLGVPQCAAT